MNHVFDNLDASDISPHETLRQSELVSRLTARIEGDLCSGGPGTGTVNLAISQWLLDNNVRLIVKAY